MTFWKRLVITIIAMLAASYLAGLLWSHTFNTLIPSYLAGIIGGLMALPVWELLKPSSSKK